MHITKQKTKWTWLGTCTSQQQKKTLSTFLNTCISTYNDLSIHIGFISPQSRLNCQSKLTKLTKEKITPIYFSLCNNMMTLEISAHDNGMVFSTNCHKSFI